MTMIRSICAVASLCIASSASADFGEYRSHRVDGQSVLVTTDRGELRLTAIDDAAFEVHYVEAGVEQLPSFALAGSPPVLAIDVESRSSALSVTTGALTASIDKSPVRIAYSYDDEPLVAEEHGYFAYDTVRGFRFRLNENEKILGGGQRVLGMDRRGQRMPLYNRAHYGYETESSQMYYSVPAIMSTEKYMIVFDNSASGWLDIDKSEEDILQFDAVAGRTAYLIVAGATYPGLIENYTDVTGRQPLPPRWAFGNFASRFGYRTEDQTRDVVRRFRQAQIPLDAVILDLYWFGPDIKGHMGNLDWDRDAFPDPERMIADFAADGVQTIPITEPFVLTTSNKWQEAVAANALARNATGGPKRFEFYFGLTGLIDVFNDDGRRWFWQAYQRLFDIGVGGTWGDLGEPEVHPNDALHTLSDAGIEATGDTVHNVFGHTWAQLVYEGQVRDQPDVRPVILMRSGFAGTQRYGIIPWTGDVSRSWGGFKPQVELSLQMGLFGLAYNHSDLGGFAGGEDFDPELYARWLQYGVFQPVYRPHAQEHIPSEPVFHDQQTQDRVAGWIHLRYSMLPYIYTLAWENSTTGMPLMRPLFFDDEEDPDLIDERYAYLWGDAFLVAPVLDPEAGFVELPVPDGNWYSFFDDQHIRGGRTQRVAFLDDTMPVLVRGGAFVPMLTDLLQTTRDYSSDRLTLHYFDDPDVRESSGRMYDDDGTSRTSLADGAYELLRFRAERDRRSSTHTLTIALERSGGDYDGRPDEREMTFEIHNWPDRPESVSFAGMPIDVSDARAPSGTPGGVYNRVTNRLMIRVRWDHAPAELRIGP